MPPARLSIFTLIYKNCIIWSITDDYLYILSKINLAKNQVTLSLSLSLSLSLCLSVSLSLSPSQNGKLIRKSQETKDSFLLRVKKKQWLRGHMCPMTAKSFDSSDDVNTLMHGNGL
jgi:hypothetical protein